MISAYDVALAYVKVMVISHTLLLPAQIKFAMFNSGQAFHAEMIICLRNVSCLTKKIKINQNKQKQITTNTQGLFLTFGAPKRQLTHCSYPQQEDYFICKYEHNESCLIFEVKSILHVKINLLSLMIQKILTESI